MESSQRTKSTFIAKARCCTQIQCKMLYKCLFYTRLMICRISHIRNKAALAILNTERRNMQYMKN
uniref:Ubiquitin-conjugating enzyme E2 2 n=1 Tax=Rhizophora mucronata TaxID=61149 RepID=A0A2P2LHE6_RHIMU